MQRAGFIHRDTSDIKRAENIQEIYREALLFIQAMTINNITERINKSDVATVTHKDDALLRLPCMAEPADLILHSCAASV